MMSSPPRTVGPCLVIGRGARDVEHASETVDRTASAHAPPEEVAAKALAAAQESTDAA